jgi:hypothetical protein
MEYRGRTTEVGAIRYSARQQRPFTVIENGQAGFVVDGAMVGTTPGGAKNSTIPFQSAQAFGIDVPPLGFSLPVKIVGTIPPGSTLPTTMPTDPKYYGAAPEGNQFYSSFDPGIYLPPTTPLVPLPQPGFQFDPDFKLQVPDSVSNYQPKNGTAVDPSSYDQLSEMQPRPPIGPTLAEQATVNEMAEKVQRDADAADQKKKLWILAGAGFAVYWFFFRG